MTAIDEVEIIQTPRAKAAQELLNRRQARARFEKWVEVLGYVPAAHHKLVINKCQEVTDSPVARYVIIMMPPGAAKSTYTSKSFPPWFLGRRDYLSEEFPTQFNPAPCILACSYKYDLAERWGREGRNLVNAHSNILGYKLRSDTKSSGEWETTSGGRYFCAGVGAGIAGHRADLGLIDDYLGSQEDADSKLVRDKQKDWFIGDFWPRLKPNASIIIIANRRHEEDLIGWLTNPETVDSPIKPDRWEIIKLPFFAEENDPLGRPVGIKTDIDSMLASRLWPEWFNEDMARSNMSMPPRIFAGLYQQRPAPEDGDFFKKDNLLTYTKEMYEAELRNGGFKIYGAGDLAVSEKIKSDRHCFGPAGVDSIGRLWIFPDIFWKVAGPKEAVEHLFAMFLRRDPRLTILEKGHISMALGPFIEQQRREKHIYNHIEEVVPKRDKETRAQSIRGLTELHMVLFPGFAPWWEAALHEMLSFPGGKHDDFVDYISLHGLNVHNMQKSMRPVPVEPELTNSGLTMTMAQLKASSRRARLAGQPRYGDR